MKHRFMLQANANGIMVQSGSDNHTGWQLGGRRSCRNVQVPLVASIEDVEMRAFETADQAAGSAAIMLAGGERLSRLWRYVFVQLLDDYTSVLRHAGVAAAARMWSGAPRATGDGRVDAAFAAMAEYLARRDGRAVPAWATSPAQYSQRDGAFSARRCANCPASGWRVLTGVG
jgi:hypothetical protein